MKAIRINRTLKYQFEVAVNGVDVTLSQGLGEPIYLSVVLNSLVHRS